MPSAGVVSSPSVASTSHTSGISSLSASSTLSTIPLLFRSVPAPPSLASKIPSLSESKSKTSAILSPSLSSHGFSVHSIASGIPSLSLSKS